MSTERDNVEGFDAWTSARRLCVCFAILDVRDKKSRVFKITQKYRMVGKLEYFTLFYKLATTISVSAGYINFIQRDLKRIRLCTYVCALKETQL